MKTTKEEVGAAVWYSWPVGSRMAIDKLEHSLKVLTGDDSPSSPQDPQPISVCKDDETKVGESIPAIESAYLNMHTAQQDCSKARESFEDDDLQESLVWVKNAIAQLGSAEAKLGKHILSGG